MRDKLERYIQLHREMMQNLAASCGRDTESLAEALVTTQLGLAVAIPITVVHHFFDRRVEKIVGDMEEKSTVLVTALIRESA